jgi:hypothetical protein
MSDERSSEEGTTGESVSEGDETTKKQKRPKGDLPGGVKRDTLPGGVKKDTLPGGVKKDTLPGGIKKGSLPGGVRRKK